MHLIDSHPLNPNVDLNRKEKLGKRLAPIALMAASLTIFTGSKIHDSYVDATTTDVNSITAVANTTPNPTIGGKDMLHVMLASGNPAEETAASHVDASELGAEISEAVFNETGENARELSANYKVAVTIEPDGDIANAEVIKQ